MKIGIYQGVDALVVGMLKRTHKNDLNDLLGESFPDLFGKGHSPFLQNLFAVPLPIRDQFVFVLLYGKSNTGIPLLDKEVILAFGMLDCSKRNEAPTLKNLCRKKGIEWKGIGKHVLQAFDKYAVTNKLQIMGLYVENANLIKYYSKFGWKLRNDMHENYMIKVFSF